MRLGDRGAELIKGFEGYRSRPYRDAVGVWTIGYGSTKGVGPNSPAVSQAQAEERLKREVTATYGAAVDTIDGLNQNQYDALCSFVYNVGPGGIGPGTGVGRALRAKQWNRAADELLKWDRAGGRSLPGLTRRRRAERKLFLTPVRDSLTGYTDAEKRWIREADELRKANRDLERQRVLRRVMTEQRQRIWRAAENEKDGWKKANRRKRYESLRARTS